MREIWANNRKFILIVAGSTAVMLVFLWLCVSNMQSAAALEADNRAKKQELAARIQTLMDEESENASLQKKLKNEILPRITDCIELKENLEETPPDTAAEGFLKEFVRTEIERLHQSSLKGGVTSVPYPSSGSAKHWSAWALDSIKLTEGSIKELRTRIFATSGLIGSAIDAGVAEISVKKQERQLETPIPGSKKVLSKIPVVVNVNGPYDRILDFLGRIQQAGFYFQISEARIERGVRDGEIRATFTLSALAYQSPSAPVKASSKTQRSGSGSRRDNDY